MKTKQIFISLLTAAVILSGVSLADAAGVWKNPTATPPGNNVDAPINVGAEAQDKAGVLRVTGFRSFFDAIFDTKVQVGTTGAMPSNLTVLAHGKVGAQAYCDESGNNCVTSSGLPVSNNTTNNTGGGSCGAGSSYDSGWVKVPASGKITLHHNLGTLDSIVYYELKGDKNMSVAQHGGTVTMKAGQPHNWYGGYYHYFYNKTASDISFYIESDEAAVAADADNVRVYMWKMGC